MVNLYPEPPAWAGGYNLTDRVVVYNGQDEGLPGRISGLTEFGVELEVADGGHMWIPRPAVTGIAAQVP